MFFVNFFYYFNLSMCSIKLIIDVDKKIYKFNVSSENLTVANIKNKLESELNISKDNRDFYLTIINPYEKLLTNQVLDDLTKSTNNLYIKVNRKLKGGFGIAMFAALIFPMIFIGKGFFRLGEVIETFFGLLFNFLEMIPLIFDPPRLMDDIMFAVSFSINTLFGKVGEAVSSSANKPKDENKPEGPFGVTNKKQAKCIDPTFSTILLLIICPPMAIFMKLGFLRGIVSAIICGVLCVKLFYFPGLLFAILHVLC